MQIGNLDGRAVLVAADGSYVDVEQASGGRFAADPATLFDRWERDHADLAAWARDVAFPADVVVPVDRLGPPSPRPRQVFGIGLNYRDHAAESGFAVPGQPTVFTKFVSCLTGPVGTVTLPPGGHTDWEVELVAVIGRTATDVRVQDAWDHVAGLTVGQDLSERITQSSGPSPQFSLGKSFPGFGPTGPWVVDVAAFDDPDDLALGCTVNGEQRQKGRTADLVFPVPELVARLSRVVTLLPGDLVFTGTPAGVGLGRDPQVWLADGDELVSWVEGIGEISQRFVADPAAEEAGS